MTIPDYVANLRKKVGNELLLLPSVSAFVERADGKILTVKLREEGGWTLPGGLMEPGESISEALIREVEEESGLVTYPVSLLGVFSGADGFRRTYPNGDEIECVELLFECRVVESGIPLPNDEVSDVKYNKLSDLLDWFYPIPAKQISEAKNSNRTLASIAGEFRLL